MATSVLEQALPPIARVGFDHGWHLIGPTFLNLGLSLLLIDRLLLDSPDDLGLDEFGTRNPSTPLPRTPLTVERSGRFLGLYDSRSRDSEPVAIAAFANLDCLDLLDRSDTLIVAVGDTWAAEQSWSALWRFAIGTAAIRRSRAGRT